MKTQEQKKREEKINAIKAGGYGHLLPCSRQGAHRDWRKNPKGGKNRQSRQAIAEYSL